MLKRGGCCQGAMESTQTSPLYKGRTRETKSMMDVKFTHLSHYSLEFLPFTPSLFTVTSYIWLPMQLQGLQARQHTIYPACPPQFCFMSKCYPLIFIPCHPFHTLSLSWEEEQGSAIWEQSSPINHPNLALYSLQITQAEYNLLSTVSYQQMLPNTHTRYTVQDWCGPQLYFQVHSR